jgi:hypothetical protein
MIGIIVNLLTLIVSIIWCIKSPGYDAFIALLCSISTLIGQSIDKIIMKKTKVKQLIKSGDNSNNTQIGVINNRD